MPVCSKMNVNDVFRAAKFLTPGWQAGNVNERT